jgi:hypothetical protein
VLNILVMLLLAATKLNQACWTTTTTQGTDNFQAPVAGLPVLPQVAALSATMLLAPAARPHQLA